MSDWIKLIAHHVAIVAEGIAGYRSACSYCGDTDCFKLLSYERVKTDRKKKVRCLKAVEKHKFVYYVMLNSFQHLIKFNRVMRP